MEHKNPTKPIISAKLCFGHKDFPEKFYVFDICLKLFHLGICSIKYKKNFTFSSKRTVDFGLSRGYSGAQEAKHRMAMQIANFAGGPGRRKRLSPGKFATQV